MDTTVHYLFNLLPATWQPYVVLVLLAAYLITKWRSAQKSAIMNKPDAPKGIEKRSTLSYIMEFVF